VPHERDVWRRPEAAGTVFDLAEPGRLVRWLGAATHASAVATVGWQWTSEGEASLRFS
jgi:hypothetical protein